MIKSNRTALCPACGFEQHFSRDSITEEPVKLFCERCDKEFMAMKKIVTEYSSWNIGE